MKRAWPHLWPPLAAATMLAGPCLLVWAAGNGWWGQ